MQKLLQTHRWLVLAAGALIQIFTGVPAAWGVFQKPVCEGYGLAAGDAALIFSCVIASFGVGCILGGLLQDKKGPRAAGVCGSVLLAAGFVAAGFLPEGAAVWFYLGFSIPVGLGCAFLYPSVMGCAQKWYSDKKGLATGIVGGAVGLSGAVLTLLGRWLIGTWSIRVAFWALGALMALVCGAACIVLENPREPAAQGAGRGMGEKAKDAKSDSAFEEKQAEIGTCGTVEHSTGGHSAEMHGKAKQSAAKYSAAAQKPPKQQAAQHGGVQTGRQGAAQPDFRVRDMLRTPQYWLLAATVCFATPAVLLFSPIIVEMAEARGLSHTAALACIVVGSVFSAAGRLGLPWLSDRTGRRIAYCIALGALAALSACFAFTQGWLVLAVYVALTFFYSGEAAVLPAAVTDLFGARHAGLNYGFAALGMSVGSLGFPLLAKLFEGEAARHWIAAAAAAAGLVCALCLKPTQGEKL